MPTTTLSSREFQQNTSRAQDATQGGPVVITKRGKPAQVLLSYEEYERLSGQRRTLAEALSMPGLSDIEFDPPRMGDLARPADLDLT